MALVGQVGLGLRRGHLIRLGVRRRRRATKNWDAGGIQAPIASLTLSNDNPQPSPCFTIMKGSATEFSYDRCHHPPHAVHLELQPQQCRPPDRTGAADVGLLVIGGATVRGAVPKFG